jgi:multicomponent Na+:H+ antiporter subunit E
MRAARTALPLFVFWVAVTGSFEPVELALGVALSVGVGLWATKFLWSAEDAPVLTLRQTGRFVLYLGYLIRSIVAAAIGVAEVVLDPHMPIEPVIVVHRTSFKRLVSRVAFANSITLTPGTLTVEVDGDRFTIHCLHERFADDIVSGELERRIARVFEE